MIAISSGGNRLTLRPLRDAFLAGTSTPSEVAATYLHRIADIRAEWGPIFSRVTHNRALLEAQQATRRFAAGESLGPCDGIPVAWKDVYDITGIPSMAGTTFLPPTPALRDAAVVTALTQAGAVCLGKTHCSELSFSVLGENEVLGMPLNPYSCEEPRLAGGSSSGAAVAVARGLAAAAIGTDSGGSVRLPAAWCGLTGFMPTRDTISRDGIVPFSPSFDSVGFIGNCVDDMRVLFESVAAGHPLLPVNNGAPVLLVPKFGNVGPLSAEVEQEFLRTILLLKRAGFRVESSDCSVIEDVHRFRREHGSLTMLEGSELWHQMVIEAGDRASSRLRRYFEDYSAQPRPCKASLKEGIARLTASFSKAMADDAYLLMPASPITAPELKTTMRSEEEYARTYGTAHALLWPLNLLDAPSITLPTGDSPEGLPIGLLLAAPRNRDTALLHVAAAIEKVLQVATEPR